ncbi:jumonji domain containing 4 [Rhodnius prolixus]|uniref:2-oxoglutarate and iron-dependent oxygenase JMJD4 n=1 Tax=Rhodnius prolixus TaxID=13249 RepID=A0A4P6DAR2_RHOPR
MEILELADIISLRKMYSCSVLYKENKIFVEDMKKSELNYSEFYTNYLMANKPCLIKSITADWYSQVKWVCGNKPNFIYLKRKYGPSEVPVANCNERYFNAQTKSSMKFNEFLDYWENYANTNYPNDLPCLYLKDWHFMSQYPEENIYRVPDLFASDWMNEYLLSNSNNDNDDYRFVYMGPKGSWTPLHADVFSSFSWSVNICGKKKWIFFPPGTEDLLKDKFGKLVYDVNSKDLLNSSNYPNYQYLCNEIVLIQEVGDAVFVPSGWHHQVWNIEDTISINHNWINACNIKSMWSALEKVFSDVKVEIADCKSMDNWEEHCQVVLKCTFGMNYSDFAKFLIFIAERRLESLSKSTYLTVTGNWQIGRNHMLFDLLNIHPILTTLSTLKLPCINEFSERLYEIIKKIAIFFE